MPRKYKYDHGLPFDKTLAKNLDELYHRVKKQKKGAILVIDGGVGEAKTTLSVHCADYVNKLAGFDEINLDPRECIQLAMGGKDFVTKLKLCFEENFPVAIYDEAGDYSKRGSLTSFNAMLNRVFDTFRTYQILVILVLPNFKVLDENLFDKGLPRGLLNCYDKQQGRYGNYRGYDHVRMQWVKHFMSKIRVKQQAYGMETPNFKGHFLDLTAERSHQLDLLSTSGKLESLEKIGVKMDGLLTYGELSIKLQKPISWLRQSVKKLGIDATKKIGTVNYFTPDIVEALISHVDSTKPAGRPRKAYPNEYDDLVRND